ncbi:MAG: hypothetical protein Fur0010_14420 [Bdellovibrio sp.]
MLSLIMLPATLTVGLFFYWKHNKNPKLGGAISLSKALWLIYAIYTWFIFIPYLVFAHNLPPFVTVVWKVFWFWMVFRGIVEIYMMYVSKNWSPIYGISHDLSCLIILIAGTIYYLPSYAQLPSVLVAFHYSLILSLALETYYAYSFFQIVKEKTKGEHAIWFASKDDPRFKKLVFITGLMNWPLYAVLILYHIKLLN